MRLIEPLVSGAFGLRLRFCFSQLWLHPLNNIQGEVTLNNATNASTIMPSRFDPEPDPKHPEDDSKVDVTKRYDVYCVQHGAGGIVVYRNVRFLRARTLLGSGSHMDVVSQVIELEQPNGQTVFISRHGIVRFCEHGTELSIEIIPPK